MALSTLMRTITSTENVYYKRAGYGVINTDADLIGISIYQMGKSQLAKKGYDANGVQRYQCGECGQIFRPTTNTIFDARKISISEWIDYCLKIFRYVSLTADS